MAHEIDLSKPKPSNIPSLQLSPTIIELMYPLSLTYFISMDSNSAWFLQRDALCALRGITTVSRLSSLCTYSRGFPGDGASNDSGVVKNGNFQYFLLAISSEALEVRPNLLYCFI